MIAKLFHCDQAFCVCSKYILKRWVSNKSRTNCVMDWQLMLVNIRSNHLKQSEAIKCSGIFKFFPSNQHYLNESPIPWLHYESTFCLWIARMELLLSHFDKINYWLEKIRNFGLLIELYFLCSYCFFGSSLPKLLRQKSVKSCRKSTGEHHCRRAISIKLLGSFIKIALLHWYSPVDFLHDYTNSFVEELFGEAASFIPFFLSSLNALSGSFNYDLF